MRVVVKGYVHMELGYADGNWTEQRWLPAIWRCKLTDATDRIFIGEQSFEVEIPDDFNPVPVQIEALEKQRELQLSDHLDKLAAINERIAKLTALTNEVKA